MITDKLKINDDEKTEFILICTRAQLKKMNIGKITVGDSLISTSKDEIKNLGTWFDCNLMTEHTFQKLVKQASFISII